jgi:hypothetical protein
LPDLAPLKELELPMSDTRSGYEEIEVINDVEGVCAVITRRKSNGTYSFMFAKVFDRDGSAERTSFMQRRHAPAVTRLLPIVCERIDQLVDLDKAADRRQSAR